MSGEEFVTVDLTDEQLATLNKIAEARKLSVNDLLAELITEYVDANLKEAAGDR